MKRTNGLPPLLILFTAFVALAAPRAAAQCTPGPHSGTITADQTWCAADSPHVLSGVVTVAPGVTLTIEAGSTVKPGSLTVQGHLVAVGTEASRITFTADADGWESLRFLGGTGLLRYVDVLKAGWNAPGIVVTNVATPGVSFEHCNLGPGNRGMTIADGVVSITDSKLEAFASFEGAYPIVVSGAASRLTLANDAFIGNAWNRIVLESGAMTGADFTLTAQTGLEAYALGGNYEIPAGRTVTFAAGTTVIPAGRLTVRGRLVTAGTEAAPTVIGSGADWEGVFFESGTGLLSHARLVNAGHNAQGITVNNVTAPGVVLDHASLEQQSQGIAVVDSVFSVNDSSIETTGSFFAIDVSGPASTLALSNNTFGGSGSVANRIRLATGAMTGADFTLVPQNGLAAYHLGDEYEIPEGRTVTVLPGVTVRQPWTTWVRGRLVAEGTPGSPVVFAAGRGDIDGNPVWIGLVFDGGTGRLAYTRVEGARNKGVTVRNAGAAGVVLDHCTIGPSSGFGGLVVDNSVVTVTSTSFDRITVEGGYPLVVRGAGSRLALFDATFTGNWRNEVLLETGAMTGADVTLTPHTGLAAYRLGNEYEVPEGRTVTVRPGVTVRQSSTTWVKGRLVAEGTPSSPVVFAAGGGDIDGNPVWVGAPRSAGASVPGHQVRWQCADHQVCRRSDDDHR